MYIQRILLKKALVIGIIFLFFGISIVPSTGNIIEDVSFDTHNSDVIDNSEELIFRGKTAYGYIAFSGSSGHPEGPCYFDLDEPGDITSLAPTQSTYFLTGGTWTCDDRWFGSEYNSGILWEIDPETGDMWSIGGGGIDCSLSYNPVNEKFYSVCGSIINSEGELICDLSDESIYLIDIAFDRCGILYGWDYDNLWIIDIETCEATLVGPLGIDIGYGGYGHFDYDTDILYISTYTSSGKLYECDEDTGECTLVGNFEGGAEITALAIPYNCSNHPPDAPIIFEENGLLFIYISDPDCDDLSVLIDWGDGTIDDWIGPYNSGKIISINHEWSEPGTYNIRAKARDIHGAESDWSDPYEIVIENNPPSTPIIDGSNKGKPNTPYNFTFNSTDPDGDDIAEYVIKWGDDSSEEIITGPFESGKEVTGSHNWTSQETFTIKAKAIDIYGADSNWSEFEVTIPRSKTTVYTLFKLFFERFLNLGLVFKYILGF